MHPLLTKLQFKKEYPILALNIPLELKKSFEEMCLEKTMHFDSVEVNEPSYLLIFALSEKDIDDALGKIDLLAKEDPIVWIAYPKKSSKKYKTEIHRDCGWAALGCRGFEPVSAIAINEDWSGLRFRKVTQIVKFSRNKNYAISAQGKLRKN